MGVFVSSPSSLSACESRACASSSVLVPNDPGMRAHPCRPSQATPQRERRRLGLAAPGDAPSAPPKGSDRCARTWASKAAAVAAPPAHLTAPVLPRRQMGSRRGRPAPGVPPVPPVLPRRRHRIARCPANLGAAGCGCAKGRHIACRLVVLVAVAVPWWRATMLPRPRCHAALLPSCRPAAPADKAITVALRYASHAALPSLPPSFAVHKGDAPASTAAAHPSRSPGRLKRFRKACSWRRRVEPPATL